MNQKEIENVEVIEISGAFVHYRDFLRLNETLQRAISLCNVSLSYLDNGGSGYMKTSIIEGLKRFVDEQNKVI